MTAPVAPQYFTNIETLINEIPSTEGTAPSPTSPDFSPFMENVAETISSTSKVFEDMFNGLNADICKQLQLLLKLIEMPGLDLGEIWAYIKSIVEFFLRPYNDLLAVQLQIIAQAPAIMTAISTKIAELKALFEVEGSGFEMPDITTPSLSFGCDLAEPEPPVLIVPPEPPAVGTLPPTQ